VRELRVNPALANEIQERWTERPYSKWRKVATTACTADGFADARAFVAAPELLQAVKFCLDEMSRNGNSREVRERACAVIAQAEGRS